MNQPLHLLLVEDESAHAKLVQRSCRNADPPILLSVVTTLAQARAWLESNRCDLVVVDLVLPDGKGISLIPSDPQSAHYPLIVLTAQGSEQDAVEAIKAGAYDYVVKSDVTLADVGRIARRAFRDWSARVELQAERTKLEEAQRLAAEILDSLPAPIALLDRTGKIRSCNVAWTDPQMAPGLYGATLGLGSDYLRVCRESGFSDIADRLVAALSQPGQPVWMEYSWTQDSVVRWIELLVKPLVGDGQRRAIVMHLDVTAQRNEAAAAQQRADALRRVQNLSTREIEVLQRIVRGLSNKDTAVQLRIAVKTVEMHRSKIVKKLEANGTSDVIRLALIAFPEWRDS